MNKPKATILTDEDVMLVHNSSLDLLENCGMIIPRKAILDILKQLGAEVDYSKQLCKFPRNLVEEFVRKAPSRMLLGARNPKNKVIIEKGKTPPVVMPNLGAMHVNDLETRNRREALLKDVEEFNHVIDGLDHLPIGTPECVVPSDVSPDLAKYHSWITGFKNTSKHICLYISNAQSVKIAMEMATAILGSDQEILQNPIISLFACIPEVLGFEGLLLDGMHACAQTGLPLFIEAGPASGATGPGTLAGTLVLSNAEIIGAITVIQILNPGTPVVYVSFARHFDMKAENVSLASPEFALLRICQGQMAGFYDILSAASGMTADSKILDVQAGYDKSVSMISAISGNEIIISDAMDQGDIGDVAELVLMDELAGYLLRLWEGIKVDENTLAIEEIKKIGPGLGNNFLSTRHTMENFRKETWLDYRISERRKWTLWHKDGAKSAETRAIELAKNILKNHNPEPLPNGIEKELNKIVRKLIHA